MMEGSRRWKRKDGVLLDGDCELSKMMEKSTRISHVSLSLRREIVILISMAALDRESKISKFSYGQFAIVEATENQSK